MSKYVEFWPLVIMKTSIFFIVLFIFNQSVYCNHTDSSVNPLNIARPKRAFEYTRWKMLDEDPDKQFVVKVLDEELSASESEDSRKSVVGVNYVTQTPAPESMIVRGVVSPLGHTPAEPSASLNEYIRFLPPNRPGETSDELAGENDTLPIPMDQWELSPKMPMLYPEREQSPPASPQFVPRQHMQPQQYVPVDSLSSQKTSVARTEDSSEEFKPKIMVPFTRMTKPNRTFNRIPSRILHVTRTESRKFKPLKQHEQYLKENRKSTEKSSLLDINYFDLLRMGKEKLLKESTTIMSQYSKDKDDDYNGDTKKENSDIGDTNKIFLSLDYNYESNDNESLGFAIDDIKVVQENKESKNLDMTSLTLGVDYDDEMVENSEKNIIGGKNEILKLVTTAPAGNKRKTKSVEVCNILNIRPLIFNDTLTLPEIMRILKSWSEKSPITKSLDITNGNLTTMENPIPLMIVDDPSGGQTLSAKKTVMIVAGVVGQDHYSVAATMYILHQLIDRTSSHQDLLNSYRFWIIPVLNPDGYDYSKSFPQYRHWRKNLRQNWEYCKNDKTEMQSCRSCETNGLRCFIQPCYGINLDRNFEYQWIPGHETDTEHPCSDLYSGSQQLSEVESSALKNYLHESTVHIDTFIAIKEGDILGIMYPYSHTKKKRARESYFKAKAQSAAQAIYQLTGRLYQAGQTSEFLTLYAGGIEDWIDGHLALDSTYSIHMFRKHDIYNNFFINMPMEKVIQETFVAIESILVHKNRKALDIISMPAITTTATLPTKTATTEKKEIVLESKSQANAPWIIAVMPSIVISLNYI